MSRRAWSFVLLALIILAYGLAGWRAMLAHTDPTEMDTVPYLTAALQIRQTGGILNHVPNLIRGVYTEATQHPLYLLILSKIARHDIQSFIAAKAVSYGIGFIFVTVFFMGVRRLFGVATAGAASWLWLVSAGFLTLVTTVACEGLLGVFIIAFWWALSLGRENRRLWVVAGAMAALAYLTKSIGILLLPVFVLSAFWWERRDVKGLLKSPWFWGFFGVFTLLASPLFIRNYVVYGTPLYSDSSGVLWVDKWEQFSRERAAEGRFTLSNYLSAHTPGDILQTLWQGLTQRTAMMVGDSLKPLPFWQNLAPDLLRGFHKHTVPWQGFWATLLALLAGFGWWKHRRHSTAVPTLAIWVIFWVFVAWYSKIFASTPPTRLLYPALILVPVYAALGLKTLFYKSQGLMARVAAFSVGVWSVRIIAVMLLCLSAGLCANSGSWIRSKPATAFEIPVFIKVQMAWSQAVSKPKDRILVGKLLVAYLFYFDQKTQRDYVAIPKVDSMDDLIRWIQKESIKFIFVDLQTAFYNPQVFKEYYHVDRSGILMPIRPMPSIFSRLPGDARMRQGLDFHLVRQ